jgi:HD superfamily phosphohydrolase
VLPLSCMVLPVPSRYEHCIGVAHLAHLAVLANSGKRISRLYLRLIIAALLHDAGNSALSHLGEPFLFWQTGMNGESYLRVMLHGTRTAKILERLGITIEMIVKLVTGTGQTASFGELVHGSMDVDNLDNVLRWHFATSGGVRLVDSELIARAFRRGYGGWYLDDPDGRIFAEAQRWKQARRAVYAEIYSEPHLAGAAMIYHAVDLAYEAGQIQREFFHLQDEQALRYLSKRNSISRGIIQKAQAHRWFQRVYALETTDAQSKISKLCATKQEFGVTRQRRKVEDMVRAATGVPREAFCIYAGAGKDSRKIELHFRGSEGSKGRYDTDDAIPINRMIAYVDPDYVSRYGESINAALTKQFGKGDKME